MKYICLIFLIIIGITIRSDSKIIKIENFNKKTEGYEINQLIKYFVYPKNDDIINDVTIVILDDGYLYNDVVSNKLQYYYDFINKTDVFDKYENHGANICSIIWGDNNYNIGINPSLKLICLKVIDKYGNVSYRALIDALEWLNNNYHVYNIGVVCMSFGMSNNYYEDVYLNKKINEIIQNGLFVVTSSGNDGSDEFISYPGNLKDVISIGSLDYIPGTDITKSPLSKFSNKNLYKPNYYAPGENILIYIQNETTLDYKIISGTSYSAAIVSAQISTILQYHNSSYDEILSLLNLNSKNKVLFWPEK